MKTRIKEENESTVYSHTMEYYSATKNQPLYDAHSYMDKFCSYYAEW